MFQAPFILSVLLALAAVTGVFFGVPRLRRSGCAATTGMKVAAPGCFVSLFLFALILTFVSTAGTGLFLLAAIPLILVPTAFVLLPNLTGIVQARLGLEVTPGQKLAAMICYFCFMLLFLILLAILFLCYYRYAGAGK